jgi:hypothetical protein
VAAAAALPAALLLGGAGCAAWRGDLDADHNRYVRQQVQRIAQADLRAASQQPPTTIEQDLGSVSPRRLTGAPPLGGTRPADTRVAATGPATTQPAAAEPAQTGPAATRPAATGPAAEPAPATRPAAPPGPPAVPLGIADLRLGMLRNNLDLGVIALDPRIAAEQVSEEEARFDAVIFGGVGYKREDRPRIDGPYVDFNTPGGDVVKLSEVEQVKEALEADVGIEVPLPTGGRVRLRQTFDDEEKSADGKRSAQYLSGLKFSVSQPLLRGAGVDANVGSIRLARLGRPGGRGPDQADRDPGARARARRRTGTCTPPGGRSTSAPSSTTSRTTTSSWSASGWPRGRRRRSRSSGPRSG